MNEFQLDNFAKIESNYFGSSAASACAGVDVVGGFEGAEQLMSTEDQLQAVNPYRIHTPNRRAEPQKSKNLIFASLSEVHSTYPIRIHLDTEGFQCLQKNWLSDGSRTFHYGPSGNESQCPRLSSRRKSGSDLEARMRTVRGSSDSAVK